MQQRGATAAMQINSALWYMATAAIGCVSLAVSAEPSIAAASAGCASANSGALDANLADGAAVTRELSLDAGDILNVSVHGSQGATASVALVGGAGAPQTLIEPTGAGAVSYRAPQQETYVLRLAGVAAAGTAAVSISCASARVAAANSAFLTRRKDLLNAQGPDRIRIDRAPTPIANSDQPLSSSVALDDQGNARQVEFSVSLSEIAAATQSGNRKPQPALVDLWVEGRMENYGVTGTDVGSSSDGNLGVLYLGTRSMLGSDILIGALAQLDRGVETSRYGPAELAATGWMAGPYMSMKLGSGVVFDGRTAWGTTENAIPGEELSGSKTERSMVRAKLTGTREVEGWKVAPSVGVVYLEDAARDGATGAAKAQGAGRVEVLPEVSRRFEVNSETYIEPRAAVGGFLGFDDFTALNHTITTDGAADMQLKAEAGVAVGVKEGTNLQATGGVESGTAAIPENWTGRLQLNVPLSK
jgi:hypothetical protein